MDKSILVNLNMNGNQLLNMRAQVLASDPVSPLEGQIWYNSTTNKLMFYDGTSNQELPGAGTGTITEISAGSSKVSVTNGTGPVVTIDIVEANIVHQNLSGAGTNTHAQIDSHIASVSNPHGVTLEQARTANNTLAGNIDMATNEVVGLPATPSGATAAVSKAYADSLVTGLIELKGDIDASTNPDYPAGEVGDSYFITVAGKVGGASGEDVNVGDLLVCKTDNAGGDQATVGADWFVVESNRDQATETVKGVAEIATQGETDTGTDDLRIVTPLKLATYIVNNAITKKHTQLGVSIGTTPGAQAIAHNLGSEAVVVSVYDQSTKEEYGVSVVHTNANTVTIDANGSTKTVDIAVIG